jgi:dihydroorotase-like cyclic amidohydrolase
MPVERPLLITGGTVLTGTGPAAVDILVEAGVVSRIGAGLEADSADVADASGCWVGPGLVDLHTHLREPG